MKKLPLFLNLLLLTIYSNSLYSKTTVCTTVSAGQSCVEYDRVSFDGGNTWENACCHHFNITPGHSCSDDCPSTDITAFHDDNNTSQLLNSIPYNGIEFSTTQNGKTQNHIIEFINSKIYLDGILFTSLTDKNIKDVIIILPNTNSKIWLRSEDTTKSIEKEEKNTEIKEIEKPITRPLIPLAEINLSSIAINKNESISFFPNPVYRGFINVETKEILREIFIYNSDGLLVYTHVGDIKTIKTDNFAPGVYYIKSVFLDTGDALMKKIVIL